MAMRARSRHRRWRRVLGADACLRAAELAPLALEVSGSCFATYRPDLKNAALVVDNKRIYGGLQQHIHADEDIRVESTCNKNAATAAQVVPRIVWSVCIKAFHPRALIQLRPAATLCACE